MGLFSFSRKNQQQSSAGNSDFYSQADEETPASRKRRQGKKREEAVDPLLPQKKRARRRLIGAIALVLAVIIGLPMILDSEPKPLSSDIAIQIPSKDAIGPRAHSASDATDKSAEPATSSTLNANEQIVETAPATKPDQARPPVTRADSESNPPPAQTDADELKKASEASTAVADAKAAAEAKKKAEDAARARAILEGKVASANTSAANAPATSPASASAAKSGGKVVVQVAALSTQEKVDELQKKLKDAGLKSYTEKINTASGVWIRVRIGPFANDAEAEKVRARLVKIGLNGKLLPA